MNISDTITVRFHRPVKVKAWADTMIRKNDAAMLHALATEGTGRISYAWEDASEVVNSTLADTWTKSLAATRIFTVTATDSFSCSAKASVLVKVNDTCITDVKLQGPESVCVNETATFQGLVTGGGLFGPYQTSWTVNPPLLSSDGSVIVPNPNTARMDIADAQPGTYTVKFTVTDTLAQTKKYCDPDGIVMSDSLIFTINAPDTLSLRIDTLQNRSYCENDRAVIRATARVNGNLPAAGELLVRWYRIRDNRTTYVGSGDSVIENNLLNNDRFYAVASFADNTCVVSNSVYSDTATFRVGDKPEPLQAHQVAVHNHISCVPDDSTYIVITPSASQLAYNLLYSIDSGRTWQTDSIFGRISGYHMGAGLSGRKGVQLSVCL